MPPANPMGDKFLNSREWRSFLTTAQSAAAYPSVINAVKASHAWLGGGAAKTYGWFWSTAIWSPAPARPSGSEHAWH